jgi:hypothetical protein
MKSLIYQRISQHTQLFCHNVAPVAFYFLWTLIFQLLALTLITYFMIASDDGSQLQDVSDAYSSSDVAIAGLAAMSFIFLLRRINPHAQPQKTGFSLTPQAFEHSFIPGFTRGAILAGIIAAAFLVADYYRYLGFFIQSEEAPFAIAALTLQLALIASWIYCEEYLFRRRALQALLENFSPLLVITSMSIIYCLLKSLQFDLDPMQLGTLFLLSLNLSVLAFRNQSHLEGSGFFIALLLVFHLLLGLPAFGSQIAGVLMLEYQSSPLAFSSDQGTSLFLTGGLEGPLSGFTLQFFLLANLLMLCSKNAKLLFNSYKKSLN